jgi:RNA polymerase sigma-70 factor (ECF subfamily)
MPRPPSPAFSMTSTFLRRYLPRLHRWAHGRLPRWARTVADTADIIHDAILKTFRRGSSIDIRTSDALAAYLHQAVRNRIRDEHRLFARRGQIAALGPTLADSGASPLDAVLGDERYRQYRAALAGLDRRDRELIVAHLELGYSHEQLGHMIGRTRNAARMALQRAVRRLAAKLVED